MKRASMRYLSPKSWYEIDKECKKQSCINGCPILMTPTSHDKYVKRRKLWITERFHLKSMHSGRER